MPKYAKKGGKVSKKGKTQRKMRKTMGKKRAKVGKARRLRLRPEAKYINGNYSNFAFGLTFTNALVSQAGYYVSDLTYNPTVGTSYTSQIGNCHVMKGYDLSFQIAEQSAASSGNKVRIDIIRDNQPDINVYTTQDVNDPVQKMYEPVKFVKTGIGAATQCIGPDSSRILSTLGRFKIIKSKVFTFPADAISGSSNRIKTFNMRVNHNELRRYEAGATFCSKSSFFLLVRSNGGNSGNTNGGFQNVDTNLANSGFKLNYDVKYRFCDP